jgi:hypothetical protein
MVKNNVTVMAVRPRDGQKLSKFWVDTQEAVYSGTPVLQLLLGQLASLEQRVNDLALAQTGPRQLVRESDREDRPTDQRRVEPKKMARFFD